MEKELLEKVLLRLNILIALQVNNIFEKSTDLIKIEFLYSFGLRPSEIAEILGLTGDKISKQLYKLKKRGGEKNA
ncbi:hypothetical protein A2Z22_00935 [Candidatus Woesebacteria bacterium RBG_16_34_12]|uniref:RNA polymerase sigma factor 70 region 4 type 2 domain-containing protein n=1 Tax=Candidatus Woesebacteria bacterium RBG_16_34_12 TaxID=1802480 RepID=A0A1F7X8Q5_9BACT|nr:MAG: hypothetical protein A2Z22_00935 [Candidatus Woesebacteria bacterium RBG_16_34_12]